MTLVIYDAIFDIACKMRSKTTLDQGLAALLFSIINQWEKDPRTVTPEMMDAAHQVATRWDRADG